MKWEAACAKKYELQVSNDAQEWKTVYANKDGRGGTEQIELEPVTARYVKLAGISRATQFGYSLFEFEIYGEKPKEIEELTPLHFIKLELSPPDLLPYILMPAQSSTRSLSAPC